VLQDASKLEQSSNPPEVQSAKRKEGELEHLQAQLYIADVGNEEGEGFSGSGSCKKGPTGVSMMTRGCVPVGHHQGILDNVRTLPTFFEELRREVDLHCGEGEGQLQV